MTTLELGKRIQIDLAEAQIIGWKLGKQGYSLREVCSTMALTKTEWEWMKEHFELKHLTEDEIKEIDNYIKEKFK